MTDIDWSKAPEGATHYFPPFFYKSDSKRVYLFDSCWEPSAYSIRQIDRLAVKRPPVESPWSGDGLPPVGTVCELSSQGAPWGIGTIQYTAENVVVWRWNNQVPGQACACYKHEVSIRPIKTQAQIAAELADQAIKKIAAIICRDGAFDIDDPEVSESAVALYDAGYRLTKVDGD